MDDDKLMGALAYVFGWLSGLIVYFVKKESKFARFHAIQSILLSIAGGAILFVVGVVLGIVVIVTGGLGIFLALPVMALMILVGIVVTVFMIYKAYKGLEYKLPFIGNLAEKYSA